MAKRKNDKTNPKKLSTRERHITAYTLRMGGATLDQIKEILAYASASGAANAVLGGQEKLLIEPALEAKQLQQDRLERMLQAVWTDAAKGRLGAMDRVLKIITELNKMGGNYAVQGLDLTSGGQPIKVREVVVELTPEPEDGN